jgi:hypothetical protein
MVGDYMQPDNIIIKTPLVDLSILLSDWNNKIPDSDITVYDDETFLPRLLVKYEFFKSTSQLRKNRPDLWRELDRVDFEELKIGHKRVWLVVGE